MVQKEENEAAEKARETQAIADDAQRDLNEALPALVCLSLITIYHEMYCCFRSDRRKNKSCRL